MKRTLYLTTALLLVVPCQRAKAPVPIYLGLALKCIAMGTIGSTAVILYRCEPDYYLCRYKLDGEETYWAVSQASSRTLTKTGGVRCEGPSRDRAELDLRAWINNKDPDRPMFPCGPLGTPLPRATWTNYNIVSVDHSINGGKLWRHAATVMLEPGEANWNVGLLGPTGTNGMTRSELRQLAECDVVIPFALPRPKEIKDYKVRGFLTEEPSGLLKTKPRKPISE